MSYTVVSQQQQIFQAPTLSLLLCNLTTKCIEQLTTHTTLQNCRLFQHHKLLGLVLLVCKIFTLSYELISKSEPQTPTSKTHQKTELKSEIVSFF